MQNLFKKFSIFSLLIPLFALGFTFITPYVDMYTKPGSLIYAFFWYYGCLGYIPGLLLSVSGIVIFLVNRKKTGWSGLTGYFVVSIIGFALNLLWILLILTFLPVYIYST